MLIGVLLIPKVSTKSTSPSINLCILYENYCKNKGWQNVKFYLNIQHSYLIIVWTYRINKISKRWIIFLWNSKKTRKIFFLENMVKITSNTNYTYHNYHKNLSAIAYPLPVNSSQIHPLESCHWLVTFCIELTNLLLVNDWVNSTTSNWWRIWYRK